MEILKRKWGKLDVKMFQKKVSEVDWQGIYQIQEPNLAYNYFEERLKSILDEMIPVSKIQPSGRNNKNWISKDSKDLMDKRDDWRNKAAVTDDKEDWRTYRIFRNKVTASVIHDRKNFLENLYSDIDRKLDVRKLFRISKE